MKPQPLTQQSALEEAARKARRQGAFHQTSTLSVPEHDGKGMDEIRVRRSVSERGCDALCDAIEDLVVRTSRRIAIPGEWRHKPLTFARAYLGMEVPQ